MNPALVRITAPLLVTALTSGLVVPAAAQNSSAYRNADDFSSEALYATGLIGAGARATGLGGNYVGISDDATALVWNPAGLAQLVRIETSLGLHSLRDTSTHDMFGAVATADATYSGLDHLAIAYPFPTYRGSLVIAGGVFRASTNDLDTNRIDQRTEGSVRFDDSFVRSQRGGLWRYTGGLAVDLAASLSFGFSLSYWEGQLRDEQLRSIDERSPTTTLQYTDHLTTDADVDGFSFDLGLLSYSRKGARLGLAVRSPVWLSIRGDGAFEHTEPGTGGNNTSDALFIEDSPRLPWSMAAGGSLGGGPLLITAEARYTAWDEIDAVPVSGAVLPGADPDYTAKWSYGGGLELTVPFLPLRLRGGLTFDPQSYRLLLGNASRLDPDRYRISAGAGLLLADSFALDASFVWATSTRRDIDFDAVSEVREERRVHITGAYRF